MATLSLYNLVYKGIHGATGREPRDPQPFSVDIDIDLDITEALITDNVSDTFDYKIAEAITRNAIEGERAILIETLASRIAERLCFYPSINEVRVKITKLAASSIGIPSLAVTKKRIPAELPSLLFDFGHFIETLQAVGGISIPILPESYRHALVAEAETYDYIKQPYVVGPLQVKEDISSFTAFGAKSLFWHLTYDFQELLHNKLASTSAPVFTEPLAFNELSLQLYEKGSAGITPHLDGKSCVNLICVFVLKGKARFAICEDRSGKNPIQLDATPGNVIILRAPGFLHSDFRPFHFVTDITEQRIVFGLRQKTIKD